MLKNNYTALAGLTLVSLLAATHGKGQGLGNSPYSRLGLGDAAANTGGTRQLGMGGVGLAAPNGVNVNDLNPALIYYTGRTTFEAGYNGQFQTVRNRRESQRDGSATLGYFSLAVPITRRWAGAVGLRPYSAVDYRSFAYGSVVGDPTARTVTEYRGTGGLAEAYLAQAVRVAKGLTVGGTASYVFGSIDLTTGSQVFPTIVSVDQTSVQVNTTEHVRYSDFTFRGAAHYRGKASSKLNYNLAGVYTFQARLNGVRNSSYELQGLNLGTTILENDQKGQAIVPSLAQAGISLDNNQNWSVSLDVARQEWSKFRAFNNPSSSGAGTSTALDDTWRAGLGGEIAPDPTSVDNYFKRMTYRAGISVAQMPYRPDGQIMYDRAISWGFSLPLGATVLDASTINLAFSYGQRGNTNNNTTSLYGNIKEEYVRAQVGLTLNSRWFIKRRIE